LSAIAQFGLRITRVREREVVRQRRHRRGRELEPRQGGVVDGDVEVADEAVGGEEHGEEDDAGHDGHAEQAVLPLVPLVAAVVPALAQLIPHVSPATGDRRPASASASASALGAELLVASEGWRDRAAPGFLSSPPCCWIFDARQERLT